MKSKDKNKKEIWMHIEHAPRDFMIEALGREVQQIIIDMNAWNELHKEEENISMLHLINFKGKNKC